MEVLGYAVGDFSGNLDDGITFDINVLVAQGTASIYLKERKTKKVTKDEVWLHLALKLPLRRHFNRDIHMFDLPHDPDVADVIVM